MTPDRRCAFIKPGGERCAATAMHSGHLCYSHRPDLAEQRSRASGNRAVFGVPAAGETQRPALEPWEVREREDLERRRRDNRIAWIRHHEHMRELHARIAADHEAAALALLGEGAR